MPAWRCSTCAVNYPREFAPRVAGKCPACQTALSYMTNIKPDEDWKANIEKPSTPAQPTPEVSSQGDAVLDWSPHPDVDSCPVMYRDDTDTVHVRQKDLQALQYYPETGDIVKLNGKYYELMGYDKKTFMWWIDQIVVAHEVAQMDALIDTTWERHETLDLDDDHWILVDLDPPWATTDNDPED